MRSFLTLVFVGLLVAVPAQAAKYVDPVANIHTVIIVSALSDDIRWQHTYGLNHFDRPILTYHTGWHLDAYMTQKVVDALKGRFTVIEDTVDPGLLEGLLPGTPETITTKLNERFAGVTPLQGLDAYVIIHQRPLDLSKIYWVSTNLDGIGVDYADYPIGGVEIYSFANYQVSVVDARNGKVITVGLAKSPKSGLWKHNPPQEICDNGIWSDTPEQLSDVQRQQLHDEILALVTKSLPYALEEAHLIPPIKKDMDITEWEGRPLACHQ